MPSFTEDQLELKNLARQVAVERVAHIAERVETTGEHPEDMVKLFRELGFLSLTKPLEYGGSGCGVTEWCIVQEEMSRVSAVAAHILGQNSMNLMLAMLGTQEQKDRFFPILEERSAVFMSTEPDAGSDVGSIRTTAVRDGDEYILNGRKQWIGGGGHADFFIVVASIKPEDGARGLGMFFVDGHESPGIAMEREEQLMGLRGASVAEMVIDNVRIPAANQVGTGMSAFVRFMNSARPTSAAEAVGLADGAMEYALRYTHERRQFGRPVYEFQAVSHMLAEAAIRIEAARELTYAAAAAVDRGDPRTGELASMAKCFATDVAMRVTTDAVQAMGAAGYSKEHPVERMMRDAKILQIFEGTNQIQRETVAKLLSRRLVKR
jgi:alkylation response protein AidB-like acyl-CoA dehydrogenase